MQGAHPSSRQAGTRGVAPGLLIACLAILALAAGCGSAPVETDSPGQAGRGDRKAAQINQYLAQRFLYQRWYPQVSDVEVDGRQALVSTALASTPRGRAMAHQVCEAVLDSQRVQRVLVSFGGVSLDCPPDRRPLP